MTRVILKRAEHRPGPGEWHLYEKGIVTICCPVCEQLAMLNHEINDEGEVAPSVVCPEDGCTFHEFVTLKGWNAP